MCTYIWKFIETFSIDSICFVLYQLIRFACVCHCIMSKTIILLVTNNAWLSFDGWQIIVVRFLRSTLVVYQSVTLMNQVRSLAKYKRTRNPTIYYFILLEQLT